MAVLIEDPGGPNERRHRLYPGVNGIGRGKENAVRIDRNDVSRHHAQIALLPDGVYLEDLASSNHCYVNGRRVEKALLNDGDEVKLSSARLLLVVDDDGSQKVEQAFDGVAPERHKEIERMVAASDQRSAESASRSLIRLPEESALSSPAEREVARLRLQLHVAARLAEPGGVTQRMRLALDLVLQHMDVDRAAIIAAISADHRELRELAQRARPGLVLDAGFYDQGMVVAALVKGGPVLSSDTGVDTVGVERRSHHSALCVPFRAQDAVLYVDNLSVPAVYCDEDVRFLVGLADLFGPVLENARMIDRLRGLEPVRSGPG